MANSKKYLKGFVVPGRSATTTDGSVNYISLNGLTGIHLRATGAGVYWTWIPVAAADVATALSTTAGYKAISAGNVLQYEIPVADYNKFYDGMPIEIRGSNGSTVRGWGVIRDYELRALPYKKLGNYSDSPLATITVCLSATSAGSYASGDKLYVRLPTATSGAYLGTADYKVTTRVPDFARSGCIAFIREASTDATLQVNHWLAY